MICLSLALRLQREWATMAINSIPFQRGLRLFDRVEQRTGQPGIADGAVVASDVGGLLRLARLDMLNAHLVSFRPNQQRATAVLRAVVAADYLWLAAPFDDLLQ